MEENPIKARTRSVDGPIDIFGDAPASDDLDLGEDDDFDVPSFLR